MAGQQRQASQPFPPHLCPLVVAARKSAGPYADSAQRVPPATAGHPHRHLIHCSDGRNQLKFKKKKGEKISCLIISEVALNPYVLWN